MEIENKDFTVEFLESQVRMYESILQMECMQFVPEVVIDEFNDLIEELNNGIADIDNVEFTPEFVTYINKQYQDSLPFCDRILGDD